MMILNAARPWCPLTLLVVGASFLCAADRPKEIAANDNRSPAGELRDGVLTLRLELGEGQWHPESQDGEAFTVYAFGETSRPLQNPGPLIRVPQGTEIRAVVHNTLSVAATVHGLHARPGGGKDVLTVQPGGTQAVRFKAGAAGTYYYWASTTGSTIESRTPIETQLAGAFVVDPPGASPTDRVFVIGVWYKGASYKPGVQQFAAVNGKSWPYAERPTLHLGESVHWRWLNTSGSEHAMHLHGFYYHLDAMGDGESYRAYTEEERRLIVTRLVEPGETFDMTWVPERAGRWLFHCHMLVHMSPPAWRRKGSVPGEGIPLANTNTSAADDHQHSAEADPAGMGGLVLGITVLDEKENSKPPAWHAERKVQLTIDERKEGRRPLYALNVRDIEAHQDPPPLSLPPGDAPSQLTGPPMVLVRGQPVEIEVVNRSQSPTAIHWHGIELESYYDGVPSWTGTSEQTTPPILPGESFLARMAPPRAGTFIYHTHWHDSVQLQNGIYGPLIVLPPGQPFDASTDKIFLLSTGIFEPFGSMVLINGSPQPVPLRLKTGIKYRFRFINITPNGAGVRVSLRLAGTPVEWRMIAKDGADLPLAVKTMRTAELSVAVGETYDFEYEATTPQELMMEILFPRARLGAMQALTFAGAPTTRSTDPLPRDSAPLLNLPQH